MTAFVVTLQARLAYTLEFSGDDVYTTPNGPEERAKAYAERIAEEAVIMFDDDGGTWTSRDVEWSVVDIEAAHEPEQTQTYDTTLALVAFKSGSYYVSIAHPDDPDEPVLSEADIHGAEGHLFIMEKKPHA
jgi:hypothetical protein